MKSVIISFLLLTSFYLQAQLTLENRAFEISDVRLPVHVIEYHRAHQPAASEVEQKPQALAQPKVNLENLYCPAFFCRVEDAIAKSSKVNFKFRLGSVNYVDAMEGKGYFEATSYSKATDLQISRTQ